jgi:hypothetical protein
MAPGKQRTRTQTPRQCLLHAGTINQSTANELSGFNTQRFRLTAVGWLVENNHSLSEFESPAFQQLLKAANAEAAAALWTSHYSVAINPLILSIKPQSSTLILTINQANQSTTELVSDY